MGIFRGVGGVGDADTDAFASEVNEDALTAEQKANEAAASAAQAAASATQAASSASSASSDAAEAAASISTVISAKDAAEDARDTAIAAKDTAVSAQAATATSETNAAASAASSSSSATAAAASETSAAASATSATVSANTATTKATEAATSATNALASANAAANSATEAATVVQGIQDDVTQSAANAAAAQAAADNAIDLEAQAAASAANALNSATAAAGSATSASASAATATTKATQSASSATAALASEAAAASSETASAASEAAAAASVTAATTQATNAATSASQAATSASNSADSATLAAASEAAAASSEANAANSATAASGAQTAAASSAAAALASQQAAATSASSAATSASSATTSATSAASSAATATTAKDTAVAAQTSASSSASAASTSATNAATSALAADQSAQDAQSIVDGLGVVATVTAGDLSNWNEAYSWGDHSLVGYVEENTSPTFANVSVTGLTVTGDLEVQGTTTTVNSTNLAIADNLIYLNDGNTTANVDLGWVGNYNDGTYAHTGVYRDATDGRFKFFDSYTPEPDQTNSIDPNHASFSFAPLQVDVLYATGGNSGQWNTAYSWGDHSLAGYADSTSVQSQIDAVVNQLNTANWDTAYSWGNHATAGYLTSFTETDPVFSASPASGISTGEISNWNTAYSWGNHAGLYAAASHTHSYLPLSGGTLTGDLSFGSQTGTWITSSVMSDAVGWNNSYGMYIGSNVGGTHYLRGNGTFTTGGSTYNLIHSGNIGSQSVSYASSAGNADTLDGIHASGFVEQLGETGSPNYQASSSRRVNPNASNPTNEHYAISTFGNEGNVTGQIATHFVSGEAYTRGYNSGWSGWRRQWDSSNDGSGSGLDADLLDGYDGSRYTAARTIVSGDWNSIFNTGSGYTSGIYQVENITSGAHSNYPTGVYTYGGVFAWRHSSSTFKLYASHTGDLVFQTGWGNDGYSGWRRVLNTSYYGAAWTSNNDGSGSGLDADLLDGNHASAFATSGHTHDDRYLVKGGSWNASNMPGSRWGGFSANGGEVVFQQDNPSTGKMSVMVDGNFYAGENGGFWSLYSSNSYTAKVGTYGNTSGELELSSAASWTYNRTPYGYIAIGPANTGTAHIYTDRGSFYFNKTSILALGNTMWHAGNDGSGSGLDADLLDGNHASYFYSPSNVGVANAVNNTGYGNGNFTYYQTSGSFNIHSGWHGYLISNHGNGSNYYRQVIALPFWGSPTHSRLEGGTQRGIYNMWTAENDGSGSGLDADLLDGYHASKGGGANKIIVTESNGYLYMDNWIHFGTNGLFSSTNGAHWYPNNAGSYGTWRAAGSKGGYSGIYWDNGGVVGQMFDGSGNGGDYNSSTGWHYYYHRGNNCLALRGSSTSSSYAVYVNGALYASDNVVAYSDRRKKENIETIENALSTVNKLRGVSYTKIGSKTGATEIGVIAQEVEEVLPEVVTYADDVDEYAVAYGNFAGIFIEAIKELSTEVEKLKAELKELKNG